MQQGETGSKEKMLSQRSGRKRRGGHGVLPLIKRGNEGERKSFNFGGKNRTEKRGNLPYRKKGGVNGTNSIDAARKNYFAEGTV